jgi:two-component system sensor histidine kinase PhoQ
MRSLHSRLLLAASLVLAGFLGVTGVALDEAFRASARASLQDRLQSYVYTMLAAADEDNRGRMVLPDDLPEPRFAKPDSGLYAMVMDGAGHTVWRSHSLTGRDIDFARRQSPGAREFQRIDLPQGRLYAISFGVAWGDYTGAEKFYTFAVAEDLSVLETQVGSFRATLWTWLGGMALVLLLAQGLILRWGLRPLRTVAADLQRIEQGGAESLAGDYPRELTGLTSSINSLIAHTKTVQSRYRNSLDDLAHSLKTPLAILHSLVEGSTDDPDGESHTIREQVERMDEIVRHQLQRAAVSGRETLASPVAIAPLVERLARSLDKVYREKGVETRLHLDPEAVFIGDEADLMEILGNLMENAYKFCRGVVRVAVSPVRRTGARDALTITIEDDGGGIDPGKIEAVLQRGARIDETVPGHGIGLTMAHEIISLYGGRLEIGASELGGSRIRVAFGA